MFNVWIRYYNDMAAFINTDREGVLSIEQMLSKRFNRNRFYSIPIYKEGKCCGKINVRKRDVIDITIRYGEQNDEK